MESNNTITKEPKANLIWLTRRKNPSPRVGVEMSGMRDKQSKAGWNFWLERPGEGHCATQSGGGGYYQNSTSRAPTKRGEGEGRGEKGEGKKRWSLSMEGGGGHEGIFSTLISSGSRVRFFNFLFSSSSSSAVFCQSRRKMRDAGDWLWRKCNSDAEPCKSQPIRYRLFNCVYHIWTIYLQHSLHCTSFAFFWYK